MYQIIEETVPYLPKNKPTYLMGVGTPANILEGVARGIDFFDCVYPSRNGRHGHVYTNMRLCVLHNLYFYNTMMEEIRDALDAGNFASYKEEKLYRMGQSSIKNV